MTKEELEKLREEAFWRGDMNEVNRINKLLKIKSKPVNENATYNLGFLPEYTITAADPNRPTSPKNVLSTFAYSPIRLSKELAQGANQGYTWVKNNPKEATEMALDFTPVVGDVKGLTYDVYQGAKQGGWQGGTTAAGLGLLGLIPGLGDVASKGFKTSIKEAAKAPYLKIKNSTLARDWKNSKKNITNESIKNIVTSVPFSQLYLNFPERSFPDRLAYMALVPRRNKDAVNAYVNLITNPEIQSIHKKTSLSNKQPKDKTNWLKTMFPISLSDVAITKRSNLGGLLYKVTTEPLVQVINFKDSYDGPYLSLNKSAIREQTVPKELNTLPLKKYIEQIQDELQDLGYVGGSTRLLSHYNIPDVPGDLEIITTENRLHDLLKKFPDLTKLNYKLNNDLLKTIGFNSSKGINNEIDADVILQDSLGNAKGRMAHLIWSATQPEAYQKWFLEFLTSNPGKSLDEVSLPLSAEEIYLLGKANPEKQVLYDLIKARGRGKGILKKNQRNWDLMHPETLPAVREATENIVRTYMPNYKSFKDQFPDFDYSNTEANLRLLNHLGYDVKIAEDPLLMQDLMEILNANALKGRQISSKTLVNGATPEIALKSLWAPKGGSASGAGGNTIATATGASGYGDYLGILLNDRSGDIIKNSDDYLNTFNLELYKDKMGKTHYPLPEELISDLKKLGFDVKTNSELDASLHIDPESELGKQVYPLLNKYGIRNTNSTGNYSNLGDGAFYSGNLDTKALLTLYDSRNAPYIELPHSHGMYEDAYENSDFGFRRIDSKEKQIADQVQKYIYQSNRRAENTQNRLKKKCQKIFNKENFNPQDLEYNLAGYKYPIERKIRDVGILGGGSLAFVGLGYGLMRDANNTRELIKDDQLAWLTKDSENPYLPIEPSIFQSPDVLKTNRFNYLKQHPELINKWNRFPRNDYAMYVDSVYAQEHPDMEWSFLNSKLERDSKMAIDSVQSDILKNADYGREYYRQSPSKMSYVVAKNDLGDNEFSARPADIEHRFDFKRNLIKDFNLDNFNPKEFSTLDLPAAGFFDNNNEFYKTLRLNYIKEHPELKLNPKNY